MKSDKDSRQHESPLEDIFSWHCQKHLRDSSVFESQVGVRTCHGLFRLDFLLSGPGEDVVAVECDGRDFHDSFRDEFRDSILLGEGYLDTIYHFRGRDITYFPDGCIWLMSLLNPGLFSERGHLHLGCLHQLKIAWPPYDSDFPHREGYILTDSIVGYSRLSARRRSVHQKSVNPDYPHWKTLYSFACEHPRASLDELIILRGDTRVWTYI